MNPRTVSARDLETMAHAAHERVELPGPEGGWATAVINGREYRAHVAAVELRCRHVSPSPWGLTQCALPDGHDDRHAYSPSEALDDMEER